MKGVRLKGLGAIVDDMLIISDVHIGYEEALNRQGYLIPRHQLKLTKEKMELLLDRKYKAIIFNGDIKHEFGTISDTEWRDTLKILDLALEYTDKVILIRGNHDTIIGPIAKKRRVKIAEDMRIDDLLITHGHRIPDLKGVRRIIIGHEHPAIALRDHSRSERYKCFLEGRFRSGDILVMPSFNQIQTGTDILSGKRISPFLNDISDFKVYITEGEIIDFGLVRDLKKLDRQNRS